MGVFKVMMAPINSLRIAWLESDTAFLFSLGISELLWVIFQHEMNEISWRNPDENSPQYAAILLTRHGKICEFRRTVVASR